MKTTIEIPDDLYKKAKIRAVESGQTLRQIVLTLLERELAAAHSVAETPNPYWANRRLLPEFKKRWNSGELSRGTDSTQIISADRDGR